MVAQPDVAPTVVGLPFATDQLSRGLEAGIKNWQPSEKRPLMTSMCDVTAEAIRRCLKQYDIPASLRATDKDLHGPRTWVYHVVTVAKLAHGPVTFDAAHGQFLLKLLNQDQDHVDPDLERRFRQSRAECVAFESGAYRPAIHDTMVKILGDEADEALMERAQEAYGEWWNPADFRLYTPKADTHWIVDQIMPHVDDVIMTR